ncbi:hypothetical protein INR49_017559 [Caranx melampygus]|nr:hypothetical protein INR49_017559 [Caranx melampygus]
MMKQSSCHNSSLSLLRSKGVILNISSASGMYPVPLLTVYSATKAFVDFFSRGLQEEYRRQGIIIQGWVTTKLVPSSIIIFLGARMNRLQRTGYLHRRKLREQKNGASLKSE